MSIDFQTFEFSPEVKETLKNMSTKLSQFQITPPVYPAIDFEAIQSSIQNNSVEFEPIIPDGYFEKTQEYQQKSLEMLQSINQNTANLYTIVDLINKTNDKQDEFIEIITEILTIAKAKKKEDAESIFKNVMKKINNTVEDAESIIKITGWAMTIYNMVTSMLPQ